MANNQTIILVHAPTADSVTLFRGAPMSLLYAISVLYQKIGKGLYPPYSVKDFVLFDPILFDTQHPQKAIKRFSRLLRRTSPAVVAISATSQAFYWAIKMAKRVKDIHPQCPIIIGGPHEDENGSEGLGASISDYGNIIDFSIQGDGEYLLDFLFGELYKNNFSLSLTKRDLSEDPKQAYLCKGAGRISFQTSDFHIHHLLTDLNYRPGLNLHIDKELNLNQLPFPPRDILSDKHHKLFSVFKHQDGILKRTAQVMTHRGCRYQCSFCTERGSYIDRTVGSVLKELQSLKNQGYEAIFFDDSTFHQYQHLGDLLRELCFLRDDLRMEFGCLTRVDSILRNLNCLPLETFTDAGFNYFYIGIEHYDNRVLRKIQKGYSLKDIDECLELIRCTNINIGVSLLFGIEGETQTSIKKTFELVANHPNIILANLSIVTYHPSSLDVRRKKINIRYDTPPQHNEPEWDLFEEGRWYHPDLVDLEYIRKIHQLVIQVDRETKGNLIPKLKRSENVLGLRGVQSPHTNKKNRNTRKSPISQVS